MLLFQYLILNTGQFFDGVYPMYSKPIGNVHIYYCLFVLKVSGIVWQASCEKENCINVCTIVKFNVENAIQLESWIESQLSWKSRNRKNHVRVFIAMQIYFDM